MEDNYSPRMRRIERANKNKSPALNLVSLMDIFTILVFFLLVNSSNVQQTSSDLLKLPEARVDTPMTESLVIQVNNKNISILGRKIVEVSRVVKSESVDIPKLVKELKYQSQRSKNSGNLAIDNKLEKSITIMGDREIPFALLKKIMLSASEANYEKVSLVVIRKPLRKK